MKKEKFNDVSKWVVIGFAIAGLIFNSGILYNDVKHLKADMTEIKQEMKEMKKTLEQLKLERTELGEKMKSALSANDMDSYDNLNSQYQKIDEKIRNLANEKS